MIEPNYGPKKVKLYEVSNTTGIVDEVERYLMPLTETSLNRLMHHGEDGMIILSAARSEVESENPRLDLTDEFNQAMEAVGGLKSIDSDALYDVKKDWLKRRNAKKDQQLRNDIREAGYSYTPVFGGYKGTDNVVSSYEPSYVVYNRFVGGQRGDFKDLERFGIDMCRKYNQDSIYLQKPGEAPIYVDDQGNQVSTSSSKNFKFNRPGEMFFTTTSRDKTNPQQFTADISFNECYIRLRPATYNERLRRTKQGEIIL